MVSCLLEAPTRPCKNKFWWIDLLWAFWFGTMRAWFSLLLQFRLYLAKVAFFFHQPLIWSTELACFAMDDVAGIIYPSSVYRFGFRKVHSHMRTWLFTVVLHLDCYQSQFQCNLIVKNHIRMCECSHHSITPTCVEDTTGSIYISHYFQLASSIIKN